MRATTQIEKVFIMCCFVFSACILPAQDIHFSQFNFSPLNQNPANTNFFDCSYRFAANYKNQWASVPVRFNTFSVSAEMNFATLENGDRVGGGLLFYIDRGGDSRFQSLNTALSVAYMKQLDKKLHHALSFGLQFGLINRSLSYDQLYFDNQWNGDVFNPNAPINETFARTQFSFFDLGTGLAYRYKKDERNQVTIGFAAVHLNQPSQTFFNDKTVKLNVRYTAHGRGQFAVTKRVDLVPELMWQMQDTKYEVVYGMHSKYYIPVNIPHTIALNTGAYARSAEAAWILAGVDIDQWQINMSYDINLSKFTAATRYNGGVEMSVLYTLCKVKKINKPGAVCPTFL